jgi:hypothetical protein
MEMVYILELDISCSVTLFFTICYFAVVDLDFPYIRICFMGCPMIFLIVCLLLINKL